MQSLASEQYQLMLDGLPALYSAQDLDELGLAMISLVRRLVPCESASYNEINPHDHRAVSFFDEPVLNERLRRHMPEFVTLVREHPVLNHFQEHPNAGPAKLSDFVEDSTFFRSELYQRFYRHFETRRQMVVNWQDENAMIGLVINRAREDFSESDRAALATLAPHLRQAYAQTLSRHRLRLLVNGPLTEELIESLLPLGLTDREAETLYWLVRGLSNAEIAKVMRIRPATVKTHVEHILGKLGASNRAQAWQGAVRELARIKGHPSKSKA